ncbi:adenosylcobinamide-GDP ribazoletransferase [Anaerosacchariphilus polymeriproducens]|uniref:Adenosylcobinamide-GDP ribazoletransferase n=1 Tax=Anaerosacchariphilus polymeriproducens TaxID=1812858 RepID=A0A371AY99_9FIRM|nr:adenosylcobinamide-GDP ribazoletransferase [Anaerosacchariphilus polymeriproducens]RDU24541.1 adenosylcobinamide-GDP ribazoletransferase [Anaerosacchariphilus polymeriproducens]
MNQIYQSFKIAISMYSKIPVGKIEWSKENMRYAMCFFPWVGIVIGGLSYGTFRLFVYLKQMGIVFSDSFITIVLLLIPVFISGGIHLDGLLDTADALSSYQEKERRLEILKDVHAGAFAIIIGIVYFLLYYGVYSQLTLRSITIISFGFVLSRTLSGLSIVCFPLAKGTGLAAVFADGAQKRIVRVIMMIYLFLLVSGMVLVGKFLGVIGLVSAVYTYFYYYVMSLKKFGGITGDVAGYFLQICELVMAACIVIADVILRGVIG